MSSVTLTDHTPEFLAGMKRAKKNMLWAIGATAEGWAKKIITQEKRVDTGRMRNSVTHVEDDDATYIGTNVEYAPYQELGTVKMRGIHFLKRAATEHKEEYAQIATEAMENA